MNASQGAPRILVVDDEPAIREALSFALARDGCELQVAASIREARAAAGSVDLIVLDLVLPDGAGLDFLRELRRGGSDVPVIVLTSRDEEKDRVLGLTLGADDYVVKPFSPREVAARVRAVLRRVRPIAETPDDKPSEDAPLTGPRSLRVEPRTRRAALGAVQLNLSRTEFNLLATLLRAPGKVFERHDLLDAVWGQDVVVGERTVDVHIKALRRKMEEAAAAGEMIETVRGVGYRLREE
jgi:DNA-binding response OmpR family regulator